MTIVIADVVNRADIGMVERRDGAGFALEAPQAIAVGREGGGKNLDGDLSSEARIARAIHLAHTTSAE